MHFCFLVFTLQTPKNPLKLWLIRRGKWYYIIFREEYLAHVFTVNMSQPQSSQKSSSQVRYSSVTKFPIATKFQSNKKFPRIKALNFKIPKKPSSQFRQSHVREFPCVKKFTNNCLGNFETRNFAALKFCDLVTS